jgi:phytoene dehydrogenase-like protein
MDRTTDVVVIGGGLAGLAAAAYLGRAGRRVTVVEKAHAPGGRAITQKKAGFSFNLGAHAVYRGGPAWRVLDELGVPRKGGVPSASGAYAVAGDRLHTLPSGLVSLLTTGLLPLAGKMEIGRLLASVGSIDAAAHRVTGASEWLSANVRSPEARGLLEALFRVSTYSADLDRLSAEVALGQLQATLKASVLYLDGGWQTMVDALRSIATSAGATIVTDARVEEVEVEGGAARGVRIAGDRRIAADAVVVAASPAAASALVPKSEELARWAEQAIPVKAATLDVALSRLPNPRATFGLGVGSPLYLSVHSASAALAPEGGALIHVMEYLTPDRKGDEARLEALLDRMQPGWRDVVVERRFLPSLIASNALVTAAGGGLAGRPGPEVPSIAGLYVAGDWVGAEGLLADASLASAKRAAELLASRKVERMAA